MVEPSAWPLVVLVAFEALVSPERSDEVSSRSLSASSSLSTDVKFDAPQSMLQSQIAITIFRSSSVLLSLELEVCPFAKLIVRALWICAKQSVMCESPDNLEQPRTNLRRGGA